MAKSLTILKNVQNHRRPSSGNTTSIHRGIQVRTLPTKSQSNHRGFQTDQLVNQTGCWTNNTGTTSTLLHRVSIVGIEAYLSSQQRIVHLEIQAPFHNNLITHLILIQKISFLTQATKLTQKTHGITIFNIWVDTNVYTLSIVQISHP